MFRTILAVTLSAVLALPVMTAPAAAHDVGYAHRHDRGSNAGPAIAIIGGLAALYLLKRHSDRRDDKRRAAPVRRDDIYRPPRRDDRRRVLPDVCFRRFETRQGQVRGYGARCMQRNVARPGSLPPECIRQVRTNRGIRNLYTVRCMRRSGWTTLAARR